LVLVAFLFAAMAAPGFPVGAAPRGLNLQATAGTIALLMVGVAAVLLFAVARPMSAGRLVRFSARILPGRLQAPFIAAMRSFAGGLLVLKDPRLFAVSFGLAVAQWGFLATSFLLGFYAFGIDNVPF